MKEPLTQEEVERQLRANQARFAVEDNAGLRAASDPLPGPLKDVFKTPDSIDVAGHYQVRAFYDFDMEVLVQLDHPLHKMMMAGQAGTETEAEYTPRGMPAWELCWLMTTPVREVDKVLVESGVAGLRAKAKEEFSCLQMGGLMAVSEACIRQIRAYWAPVLGYAAPEQPGDDGAKKNGHASLSGPPPTATAG